MAFASAGAPGARRTSAQAMTASRTSAKTLARDRRQARQERSDKIKRAAGGAGRRQGHERQVESENDMSPTNAANWGLKQGFGTL